MIIKERKSGVFHKLKFIAKNIGKFFLSKKVKLLLVSLVILSLIFIGIFAGLLLSGFFGTLNSPSRITLNTLKWLGFNDLESIKTSIDNIYYENIKIPLNYIKGKFSNPEKMYIDISFQNYQKIEKKREEALRDGILTTSEDDWVPAVIKYKDEEKSVKLRLKGDWLDHIDGDKWSFRIKVKNDETIDRMKVFSIQDPKTRVYLSEFLYLEALRREDVLAPRYEFIEVIINGNNKGIYALEEHFETQLIESNNRRDGVFIKFNEDLYRTFQSEEIKASGSSILNRDFYSFSDIDTFDVNAILEDPVKRAQFDRAKNLLESFRIGKLKTHEVFDVDKLAKYYAISTVLGSIHGAGWHNIRFYYNPITSLLEPIGYDGSPRSSSYKSELLTGNHPSCIELYENYETDFKCSANLTFFDESLFGDSVFFESYMKELERVTQKPYLDELFSELNDKLNGNLNILHKDNSFYHFPKEIFYYNQDYLYRTLNPPQSLEANFESSDAKGIMLSVGNINSLPIEILGASYNDSIDFAPNKKIILQPLPSSGFVRRTKIDFQIPDNFKWVDEFAINLKISYRIFGTDNIKKDIVLPFSSFDSDFYESDFVKQAKDIKSLNFLEIDEAAKSIKIKRGSWIVNRSLIFPEGFNVLGYDGTTIDLIDSAAIFSYSPLELRGNKDNYFRILSSDKTGEGLVVLKAKKMSIIEYAEFKDLKNAAKDGWEQTGALDFYESPVSLKNVIIRGMNSEDSLNIIRSNFIMENSLVGYSFADCVDIDFGIGKFINSSFINCGGDALDFSGSEIEIKEVTIENSGDKGVSAGERSNISVIDSSIDKSYICLASKDESILEINGLNALNCNYGLAAYQKKPEFGPASINAKNVDALEGRTKYIIEENSDFLLNGKIILGNRKNVYDELYPNGG